MVWIRKRKAHGDRLDDTREKRMHYCTAVQYSNFEIAQCLRLCCDPLKTLLNLAQHLIMKTIHYHQYSNETLYGIKSDTVRYTWAGYFIFIFTSSLLGNTTILIASIKYRVFKLHRVFIVIIYTIFHNGSWSPLATAKNTVKQLKNDQFFATLAGYKWF